MTPNATVSYMAAQAERQLVEAKAARAWIVDEAVRNQAPGSGIVHLPLRLIATLAARIHGLHRPVKSTQTLPNSALGMADPAR
jgi:hypothetical protein